MEKWKMPLSGNTLKIIAALSMLIDHVGIMFFPEILLFRILGRLAFPVFAFFIAEGCRYTRNRTRYLATLAGMAILFQVVYYVAMQSLYMSIFVTFSLAVLLVYSLDFCKRTLNENSSLPAKVAAITLFLFALVGVYLLNVYFQIDYGFLGCITPLCATLFQGCEGKWQVLDSLPCRILAMGLPLLGLAITFPLRVQWCALFALPLLLLYSGKRGRYKMKYFFYVFYPAHLVLLYGISFLL